MAVRDTSLIAYYEKVRKSLEPDEDAVFCILLELGPAHDRRILEALNQKEQATLKPKRQRRRWEINQVTGRRNGLLGKGVIEDLGAHNGRWHDKAKTYHLWRVRVDKRQPAGWSKLPAKEVPQKNPQKIRRQREQRIERSEQPVLRSLRVSEAGRVLREYRRVKGQRQTVKTAQGLLDFA